MTPPDHLIAGLSAGTVYLSVCRLCGSERVSLFTALSVSMIFAVLPDIDSFRGVYSSTDPLVGHRGMTHSLLFVTMAAFLFSACYTGLMKLFRSGLERKSYSADIFLLGFLAGLTHLLLDLPQVPGVWKGIPLFFPLMKGGVYLRTGGWGLIGWYDYRITWILVQSVSASIILLLLSWFMRSYRIVKISLVTAVLLISLFSYFRIVETIASSEFKSSSKWNSYQKQFLDTRPRFFRKGVIRGREIIYCMIFSR